MHIAVWGISFHSLMTSFWFYNFSVLLGHQLFSSFKKKVIIKSSNEVLKVFLSLHMYVINPLEINSVYKIECYVQIGA